MTRVPDTSDVVIVGGGIIGTAAAYYLARGGIDVTLCEKGRVAGEQSSRNWGFVRQQGRDPAEIPTIIESLRLWNGLAGEIGEDVGFARAGSLYLASTERQLSRYEAWLEHARQYQLDTRLLSREEVRKALPGSSGEWIGGLHTPSDGRAEPALATPALARAARRQGAIIVEQCAVRGLDIQAGRVSGVVTEHGRIATSAVLCAGGAWSSLFCARHGIVLPQLKVRSSVFRTAPAPLVSETAIWSQDVAFRRRQDGGYTVAHGSATEVPIVPDTLRWARSFMPSYRDERSRLRLRLDSRFLTELRTPRRWRLDGPSPFEATRVNDPAPSQRILGEAARNLARLFPALAPVPVVESWAGLIDVTPDAVPVIAPVDALPGFHLATGFSGHGFGIGPAAGRLAAEMVSGAATSIDRAPFRLERFFN
ncbi:MAG: FAD-binding oxidoreductase [Alphaproteobacteria bacterium]|nr:FAD-binding oxidoreductase [Alphaproteobacteria bacterium]